MALPYCVCLSSLGGTQGHSACVYDKIQELYVVGWSWNRFRLIQCEFQESKREMFESIYRATVVDSLVEISTSYRYIIKWVVSECRTEIDRLRFLLDEESYVEGKRRRLV